MSVSVTSHVRPVSPDPVIALRRLSEEIKPVTPVAWDVETREDYAWTLLHEAAHALMAMECGLEVEVDLTETGARVKWKAASSDLSETTRSLIEARILLAGYGVSKFFGAAYCIGWRIESVSDRYVALAVLERGCGASNLLAGHIDDAYLTCHPDTVREACDAIRLAYREMLAVAPVESVQRIRSKEEAKALFTSFARKTDAWVRDRLTVLREVILMWAEASKLKTRHGCRKSGISFPRNRPIQPATGFSGPVWAD
jgi:hypothetical protein